MIIRLEGPEGRRRVTTDTKDTLHTIITTQYNINLFKASLSRDFSTLLDTSKPVHTMCKEGSIVYLDYVVEAKEIKKEESIDKKSVLKNPNAKNCSHPDNVMCGDCAPLDPWDEKYHFENKIKYLSYNSYLAMMKTNKKIIEPISYTRRSCDRHAANAVCTQCYGVVTLAPQRFRMVDHIEIRNELPLLNFVQKFSVLKKHGFAFLVGRYADYDRVPGGIRAEVHWCVEIDILNFPDGFILQNYELNLPLFEIVGMVYTAKKKDYFLSGTEIAFIAQLQDKFRFENNSRFVTLVAKEEADGFEFEEYMVSEQCMALVRDSLILPTTTPTLMKTFIDIRFRDGKELKGAEFIPVEFFIVRPTHGLKQKPFFTSKKRFDRNFGLKRIADYFSGDFTLYSFSNLDLILRLQRDMEIKKLVKAVEERDEVLLDVFVKNEFLPFRNKLKQYEAREWICKSCTFLNSGGDACEMCGGIAESN